MEKITAEQLELGDIVLRLEGNLFERNLIGYVCQGRNQEREGLSLTPYDSPNVFWTGDVTRDAKYIRFHETDLVPVDPKEVESGDLIVVQTPEGRQAGQMRGRVMDNLVLRNLFLTCHYDTSHPQPRSLYVEYVVAMGNTFCHFSNLNLIGLAAGDLRLVKAKEGVTFYKLPTSQLKDIS